jgi:hypothetical protein
VTNSGVLSGGEVRFPAANMSDLLLSDFSFNETQGTSHVQPIHEAGKFKQGALVSKSSSVFESAAKES